MIRAALISSLSICIGLALPSVATAAAKLGGGNVPAIFQKVIDCRKIADDKARLQCFDTSMAQLDTANAQGDIAVVDRAEVDHARRSLFGFTLPSLAIFDHRGGDPRRDEEEDEIKEITAKITSVGGTPDGWAFTLDDGARWDQSDSVALGRAPKAGMTAVIKRGVFDSYKMSINGGPSIKVRRVG